MSHCFILVAPPAPRLGRLPPKGDAEPAHMHQPAGHCPKFRWGGPVCSLCVGLEGRTCGVRVSSSGKGGIRIEGRPWAWLVRGW